MRSKLVDQVEYTKVQPLAFTKGTLLPEALDKYLSDLEALGRTDDTLATYRHDITPFVQNLPSSARCAYNFGYRVAHPHNVAART
jgi:hypothetical protein